VKFTLDLLADAEGALTTARYDVTVVDDSTYRIRYERPGLGSPLDDYTVIYPKHLLDTLDREQFGEWAFWTAPIGSGPFRHVRTVEGFGFEFEANPDYFRGPPRIDRVVLKFGAPQPQQLLSGDVDVLPYATELRLQAFRDDERFATYHWYNAVRMKAVLWNHRSPLFADPRVRRALAHAVDRREILQAVGLPGDVPAIGGLYSERQFRRGHLPAPAPFDPNVAQELLQSAGWHDTDADGVRDREGRDFRFTLFFRGGTGSGWVAQGGEAVAIVLREQLRKVGVDVELQPLQGSVTRERVQAGTFEAVVEDVAGLPTRMWYFGADNYLGYQNARVAGLLDRIGGAFDPDSVDHFYRELADIFAEEHPALLLYPAVSTTVAHRRLRGLSAPYRSDAVWYLEDLWIEN
jgi:peptide/nickel transport system substrate-binding protein